MVYLETPISIRTRGLTTLRVLSRLFMERIKDDAQRFAEHCKRRWKLSRQQRRTLDLRLLDELAIDHHMQMPVYLCLDDLDPLGVPMSQ